MANNRIYIHCTGCNHTEEALCLGKRYHDGYYGAGDCLGDNLSEWFDKHKHCGGTEDHFSIVYDHPENYELGADWKAIIETKLTEYGTK